MSSVISAEPVSTLSRYAPPPAHTNVLAHRRHQDVLWTIDAVLSDRTVMGDLYSFRLPFVSDDHHVEKYGSAKDGSVVAHVQLGELCQPTEITFARRQPESERAAALIQQKIDELNQAHGLQYVVSVHYGF